MIKEQNKKAPNLRFKGFTNDWEQRKLGEVSDRVLRRNKNLESKLPLTISAQDGLVDQTTYFHKQVASKQLLNYLLLLKGEFAYNKSYSVGFPYGTVKRLDRYDKGVLSTLYLAFNPKNIYSDFLKHYYDTDKWYHEIYQISAEGARNHGLLNITATDFFNTKVNIPSNCNEQIKVAKFFNCLARIITLQQRKLDLLKQLKTGLLQKMFANKDTKQPALRFNGFSGNWEQRKLGDLMNVTSVKRIHQSDWQSEGIPFYRARDIVALNKGKEISEPLYISREKYEEYSKISGKVKYNDLLVTGVGTIGIPFLVRKAPLYFKDGNIIWFQNNEKINGYFLYSSFLTNNVQDYIKSSTGVGTVPTYTIKSGKETPIKYPNTNEQDKIAVTIEKVSYLITLHKNNLNRLGLLKKSLLQKMFV